MRFWSQVLGAIILLVSFSIGQQKQMGRIAGQVVDAESGEPLIGANVFVEGTTRGASTDIEGRYIIAGLSPGKFTIIVSMVSYARKRITDVVVEENRTTQVNVGLSPEAVHADEVVIEARASLSYEGALLTRQKSAASIGDGISAEQVRKTPDATTSDILKRMPGLTIVDNKFVYVRGTSDRYNNVLLNGVRLASTETDKKSFAFDLLPSTLLDNAIVSKSSTPDLPGDFSGGLVQLNTNDFPQAATLRVSAGSAWTSGTTRDDFVAYQSSPTDWLGFDSNLRTLPEDFPSSFAGLTQVQKNESARKLKNLWATDLKKAPLNSNFEISYGNTVRLFESQLGFIGALTYRNGYTTTEMRRADYDDAGLRYDYSGQNYNYSVLWGAILNAHYFVNAHNKIGTRNTLTQSGDDEVTRLAGFNNLTQNDDRLTSLKYVSRRVFSTQVEGEHYLEDLGRLKLEWKASYSSSNRNEPDHRRMIYSKSRELPGSQYEAQIPFNVSSNASSTRFYSLLDDFNRSFETHVSIPVFRGKVKLGALHNYSNRFFSARNLIYTMPVFNQDLVRSSIEELFVAGNIGGSKGLQFDEYDDKRNRYTANQKLNGAYAMVDIPFNVIDMNLRFIGGVRLEDSHQELHSGNLQNEDVAVSLETTDLLPSANLIYVMSESMNLRFAYSRTLNRPEFREFAPFSFYDFATQLAVYGNPALRRALVNNYDARWEFYPNAGEVISVSYFQKYMTDPIEQIVVTTVALAGERTFENAPAAEISGVEVELRKSMDFLGHYFENLSLFGNYSRVQSRVRLQSGRVRPLQGQSSYTLNAGLTLTEPTLGTTVQVSYNKFGERISEVATVFTLDVKEQPRSVVDITLTQPLWNLVDVKLSGKDILQEGQTFAQGDNIVRLNKRSSSYSVSVSIKM